MSRSAQLLHPGKEVPPRTKDHPPTYQSQPRGGSLGIRDGALGMWTLGSREKGGGTRERLFSQTMRKDRQTEGVREKRTETERGRDQDG